MNKIQLIVLMIVIGILAFDTYDMFSMYRKEKSAGHDYQRLVYRRKTIAAAIVTLACSIPLTILLMGM